MQVGEQLFSGSLPGYATDPERLSYAVFLHVAIHGITGYLAFLRHQPRVVEPCVRCRDAVCDVVEDVAAGVRCVDRRSAVARG